MASFIHRTTCEYVKFGNLSDHPVENWIRNPNLSAVVAVDCCYWKINVDAVEEMNEAEKEARDTYIQSMHEINTTTKLFAKTTGQCQCSNTAN